MENIITDKSNQFLVRTRESLVHAVEQMQISEHWAVILQSILVLVVILLLAWVIDRITTLILRKVVIRLVGKTKNQWDDILLKNRVFARLAHFLPGFVILALHPLIASGSIRHIISNLLGTYFIIVALWFVNAFLNSLYDFYFRYNEERAKQLNIKIYLQLLKVVVVSLGVLGIFSLYANKSFMAMLGGLGAILTILLIVYKDTIMGFVAGIQLTANKMVKVGDWISRPGDGADGTVIDISLNTVKVQNWDKTITTIPTYKLMSEPFTNWIGMEESGGRRIKRHINIDIASIHFLSPEEIAEFSKIAVLKNYIAAKQEEISEANAGIYEAINQRKLTNIGTFRKYVECYLLNSGYANTEMSFLVRQLQSTDKGLPLEVYMFSIEKDWRKYEHIQSDIFDHILAMVPKFNLRVFQNPSGESLRYLNPDYALENLLRDEKPAK